MKHQTSQILYEYWNDIRGIRIAPQRFEIEPSRFSTILPDTFILELDPDGTYPYRLAGTRLCEHFGDELRGTGFTKHWCDNDRACLDDIFDAIINHAAVGLLEATLTTQSGAKIEAEITLLPITHSFSQIDRILGSFAFDKSTPWSQIERIERGELTDCRHIWPDGRPGSIVQHVHRQVPFLPQIRLSRIVRQDRRQFRVYDGGLASTANEDQ